MKKINICGKEFNIDCNAFTYLQYKKIFNKGIFEDFKTIAQVFNLPIKHTQSSSKNPILYLQELQAPALQLLPFVDTITFSSITKLASTDSTRLSADMHKFPQIYIPIPHENH